MNCDRGLGFVAFLLYPAVNELVQGAERHLFNEPSVMLHDVEMALPISRSHSAQTCTTATALNFYDIGYSFKYFLRKDIHL